MADLSVSHRYPFPVGQVFDAWLDAKIAGRFLFATPTGEMIRAEIDPKVGGRFIFVDRRPDMGDVEHVGEYLEIDRPRRLVFTFAAPQFDPGQTTVTLDFEADGDGCVVTLRHSGVLEDWTKQTVQGWTTILASLETALS